VSPLWREHLLVGLAPERLSALRVGTKLRPGIVERHEQALPAASAVQWDATFTALEILLEQPAWRGLDLTVILSSQYVHYAVIPAGKGLANSEQNDLAHLIFRNTFGDLSHDWELRVSPAGNQPTLASGVPHAFLKGLRDACDGRGRLRSIQPALMTLFNKARSAFAYGKGTLALVEAGRISLAALDAGQWQTIVSRAAPSHALIRLLEEESELHGRNPGGVLWLCDMTGEAQLPAGSEWQLQSLKPPGNAANGGALVDWGLQ
jgi:hypothetical protein